MPGDLHQLRVSELVAAGSSVHGWRSALRELLDTDCHDEIPTFIPDAFRIEGEFPDQCATAYEVMVTNFVGDEKLCDYAELWWLLDCEAIGLRLVWVRETGQHSEVDLRAAYYGEILGKVAA